MRKSVLLGLVAVVIVLGGLVAWYVTTERRGEEEELSASAAVVLMVLQQTVDAGATLLSSAVVGIDDIGGLSVASISPELLVRWPTDASDVQLGTLEDLFRSQGLDAARNAVAGVLNLEIPFMVAVSVDGLAAIIDAAGGVEPDPPDGTFTDGGASGILSGDDVIARLLAQPRGTLTAMEFEQMLLVQLVGRAVPGDIEEAVVRGWLNTWAENDDLATNLTAAELEQVLGWMALVEPATTLVGIVPTVPVNAAPGVEPLAIDTARMVARLFRATEFLSPGQIRVAVFNGNGARQLATATGTYLEARGFNVVRTSNADSFEYERTYIVFLGDETKAAMLHDVLSSDVDVVRPEQFEPHYTTLAPYVPVGTDLLVVLGAGFAIGDEAGISSETDEERQS
ncbi:LytR C-terminal domain-containing protein [Candidatus Bipolaricaulota bacterium]|nr:LytR C-terminal domain-containing protein [Candidatus Bipolaricaulota bacterium]